MNKKRMSERKSQLRLDIQDYCMGLSQNSDPIIGYLLTILQWQASLDIQTNSILHKAFTNEIQELKCKLRMQIKTSKSKRQDSESHKLNIAKHIKQFHKLKQVFSYCLTLSKKKSQLNSELQKFNQYAPIENKFTEDLEDYLNQPIIFQTIFHSYLRAYNVNILTADLISFLYAQHQQKTSQQADQTPKAINKWSNSDMELLNSKSIIFKQLTDMSKKYVQKQQKLKSSYIHHLCHDIFQTHDPTSLSVQDSSTKEQHDTVLRQKVKGMNTILNKIRNEPTLCKEQNFANVLLQCQPLDNLNALEISEKYSDNKVIEANKQFFLETLYGKLWTETFIGDEEFTFMRQKIIKVQALSFLNRILSTINLISFIYNQLDLKTRPIYQFEFSNLRKLIGSQFISKSTFSFKVSQASNRGSFYSIDSKLKTYNIADSENNKLLYPSAVNYFFCFIKNMLSTDFQSKEGLLQILQAKSEYLQSLAETILNIYEIIKVKQLSCYKLLRQLMQTILKSSCWNGLGKYRRQQEIMRAVNKQKEKIGIISQIIYQFDHNYSIKEPLEQLIRIQFDGLTRNCDNTFLLYKCILSQIIQIRNGLKLDHYYSVNQIHENFSLIPSDIQRMDQKTKRKQQDLYFQDIIHQICLASQTNLHLPKLFFFFDLQLKFKRIVFKLQLCWSSNLQSMFQKKVQAFKDFLSIYCSPIFQLVNQCHNIIQILDKLEQIQRCTEVFSRQVSRFHLIQKIVKIFMLENQDIQTNYLRECMNRVTISDLEQLSILLTSFNPVECQKQSNRRKFVQALSKHILKYSSIRLQQLQSFNPKMLKQKQKLASIIVLLQMLRSRNQPRDHSQMITLYRGLKPAQDLYQRKLAQQSQLQYKQCLKSANMEQLIKYKQQLMVMSILKTLRDIEQELGYESEDYKELYKLMNKFELSRLFNNLESIQEIQFWKNQLGIMTKYHQIYQLMYYFDTFDQHLYGGSKLLKQSQNRPLLSSLNHKVDFNHQRSDFITKLYFISQISQLSRQKVQKNIQALQKQIIEVESVHRSIIHYRTKLKKKIYIMFCQEINKVIQKNLLCQDIDIQFDGQQKPSQYIDMLRKKMLRAVSEYKNNGKEHGYGKFSQIEMFKVKKGYELSIIQAKQNKQYKIGTKKHIERAKKPLLSPHNQADQKTRPLQSLKRKYKTQMLKKSIQIRKQISKMQLNENKIRQEIIWQTSKLEHSVVEKINQFIALSNVDQQQSYINFKHAVNLQTMKGIQNVIQEQTQMYMEKKNAVLEEDAQGGGEQELGFITAVVGVEDKEIDKNIDRSMKHLDANIESMLAHMKKIKFFSAWKKQLKKTDLTKKEWCNFNLNVQKILNNDKIVELVQQIENCRNNYLQQNVTCQIMKQQNLRINDQIQELKINNLQKKVKSYRDKLSK